jgi:hypothetical protein
MSTTRYVNGQPYLIPDQGDTYVWGTDLSNWAGAVSNNTFQKNGGPFTLSADADFGPNFGLKSAYLSARTTPSDSGFLRLGNTDTIKWRNAANSGNNTLSLTGDVMAYSGAFTATAFTGDGSAVTNLSAAAITGSVALVNGGMGSTTAPAARTALGLGNVDNTSDINKPISTATQTALDLKANLTASSFGQCRFQYTSTSVCTLVPYQGNLLNINGTNYPIPSAGVTLAAAGLTASTTYNVYAYMAGATMTLEASTTAHSTSTATGMEIKTGDATRSLVGKVYSSASTLFTWSVQNRLVLSWFNQRPTMSSGGYGAARGWSTAAYAELDAAARLTYLAWAGTAVQFNVTGAAQQNTVGGINAIAMGFNSAATPNQAITITHGAAGSYYAAALSQTFENVEGLNYVTPLCWVNAGTGTFSLATSAVVYT